MSIVVALPWIASLEKKISASSAHKPYKTTVVVRAGPTRGNELSRSTQSFVSMSKSHVTGRWLSQPVLSCPSGINARIPRLLQWPSKEGMHEVNAWVWGSVRHGNANRTVHLGSQRSHSEPYYLKAWRHRHANLEASCLLLHVLVACTLVELPQAFRAPQASEVGMPCCQGTQCGGGFVSSKIWTHLLLYSCVVHVRVWVLLKLELCMVSSQRKRCIVARHLSVVHTLQVWLHVSLAHFQCLYRPGLKAANKPRYRLLRRKLWSVRFSPIGSLSYHLSKP